MKQLANTLPDTAFFTSYVNETKLLSVQVDNATATATNALAWAFRSLNSPFKR